MLIPEALALLPLAAFLILLLRGRFSLSAHLLLSTALLVTWIIMFVDRSGELSRLDTIAFVLGLLTLTPLVVARRKRIILIYGAANLAVNARDAMPDGGTLTIETRSQRVVSPPPAASPLMKPGDFVILSVADTGSGIPAEDLHRIFDPFFTTKQVGQGTGLGLASVYGAVQQNGGAIEVRSELGRGTMMTIYFRATGLPPRAVEPEARPGELPGGSEAVLLVEDDAMVRDFIQLILANLGYRVLAVGDGAAALDALAASAFDMLLTDVILPDVTGMTLVAQARQLAPSLKVIYMSGHAESTVLPGGAGDGAQFLAKPFTVQELARKVRGMIDS